MKARAVLIKNGRWSYVNGRKLKPEIADASAAMIVTWVEVDEKALANLTLAIHSDEPDISETVKRQRRYGTNSNQSSNQNDRRETFHCGNG